MNLLIEAGFPDLSESRLRFVTQQEYDAQGGEG